VTGQARIQDIPISELAKRFGTPLFVYDGAVLESTYAVLRASLHARLELFFSLKANPNVSVCAVLASAGARAEISSLVELITARRAGVAAEDIVFLGPGKSEQEIAACLDEGVFAIVAESLDELTIIDRLAAARGRLAPVMLRVNPAFSVKGSGLTMGGKPRQFGIDEEQVLSARSLVAGLAHVRLIGVHAYLGTRILDPAVVAQNTERILALAERVAGALDFDLLAVDVGGGLGVAYFQSEEDPDVAELGELVNPVIREFVARHPRTRLIMELGRALTAPAGLYVVRARYIKPSLGQQFIVADGGTNHHMAAVGIGSFVKRNFPVRLLEDRDPADGEGEYTITGPLCTPNDTLAKDVQLPSVRPGDLLGIERSGAYGPTASPVHFLSHGYPAEVLVHNGGAHLVRERDEPADLLRKQRLLHLDPDAGIRRVATTNGRPA
jgi:diaminopimelate decarboxylase